MIKIRRSRMPLLVNQAFVSKIVTIKYTDNFVDQTIPDGCWDLHFLRGEGETFVFIDGARTQPCSIPYQKNDELLCIQFNPHLFLPDFPAITLVDCKTFLQQEDGYFFIGKERFEIPTFENADFLIRQLIEKQIIITNTVVEAMVIGNPQAVCQRSMQRHFRQATGMTWKQYQQIKRAEHAAQLLRKGESVLDVASDLGYSDQPHMTRSLKKILGQTPREIVITK